MAPVVTDVAVHNVGVCALPNPQPAAAVVLHSAAVKLHGATHIEAVTAARTRRDSIARDAQWADNTKGYSSTYLAMGFANVRAGTR